MTTQIGASVFVDPTEITHSVINGCPTITFGPYPTVNRVDVHLRDVAGIDAVIAELVALKQEMDPPGCICDIASADQCKVHRRDELHDGPVTEFTSDSRLVKTAPCTQPEYHGAGLLGGKPNMPVLCDRPEHHEPASVTA